ncbi:MAG: hypothetical protein KJ667_09165 [Alphaproteobacteria bacterium]|nr:hypothetical protein [Alphaproteobacteria bacterium]
MLNYGQVIDSYQSRGQKLVTIWDITAQQRFTVTDEQDLQVSNLVAYENAGFTGKCPETAVSALQKIARLPDGLKPII